MQRDGEIDGLWTDWSKDGKESFELIYIDGEPWNGKNLWLYTTSELKALVKTYKNGVLIFEECWDEDGNEKECN